MVTYVAANLVSDHISPTVEPVNFECLFVNIIFHENKQLTIGNIYRPPSSPADSTMRILSTINSLGRQNKFIILGDFNCNWLDRSSHKDRNLFDSVHLTQLINKPTRVDSRSSSLLDWILVSNPDRIVKSGVMPDCLSDHSVIFCVWKIEVPRSSPKFITFSQSKNINENNFMI